MVLHFVGSCQYLPTKYNFRSFLYLPNLEDVPINTPNYTHFSRCLHWGAHWHPGWRNMG